MFERVFRIVLDVTQTVSLRMRKSHQRARKLQVGFAQKVEGLGSKPLKREANIIQWVDKFRTGSGSDRVIDST